MTTPPLGSADEQRTLDAAAGRPVQAPQEYFVDTGPPGLWSRFTRRYRSLPVVPMVLLAPLVVFGLFGRLLYPHDPTAFNLGDSLLPPAWMPGGDWTYILGTDQAGRDLLTRIMAGATNSLIIAVTGVAIGCTIGVAVGMAAGFGPGMADSFLMRVVDMQMSIPPILFAVLVVTAVGRGVGAIIGVVAIAFWTSYARVTRGETLSLMQREFVELARVAGASRVRILRKHVLPNVFNSIVVLAAIQLGIAILLESGLTFLGLGLQPPDPAWGLMIAQGRDHLSTAWWISTFPGLAIFMTVLGANLLGDWLRDRLDPRLRQV